VRDAEWCLSQTQSSVPTVASLYPLSARWRIVSEMGSPKGGL
jgi:hypothetical protein